MEEQIKDDVTSMREVLANDHRDRLAELEGNGYYRLRLRWDRVGPDSWWARTPPNPDTREIYFLEVTRSSGTRAWEGGSWSGSVTREMDCVRTEVPVGLRPQPIPVQVMLALEAEVLGTQITPDIQWLYHPESLTPVQMPPDGGARYLGYLIFKRGGTQYGVPLWGKFDGTLITTVQHQTDSAVTQVSYYGTFQRLLEVTAENLLVAGG